MKIRVLKNVQLPIKEYKSNNFEAAIKKCDSALAYDPQFGDAWAVKGLALKKLNELEKALECFNMGAEADPNNWCVFFDRAEFHHQQNRLREALADFTKSIALRPDDPQAYSGRSAVYADLHMPEEAASDAARAAQQRNRLQKALADFTKSIALRPDDPQAYSGRSAVYADLHMPEEAASDAARAAQLKAKPRTEDDNLSSPEPIQSASGITPSQIARAERSRALLEERSVPMYWHPLYVEDDAAAIPQLPEEVAKRTLVLWVVELRSDGLEKDDCHSIIDRLDLWENVSRTEQKFLLDPNPDPIECRAFGWRAESIWVMLWALGYIDVLAWPSEMCDVDRIGEILTPFEESPALITNAKLRPVGQLLDARDLTMKIHWAILNTRLHGAGMIPKDLDWRKTDDRVFVDMSHAAVIVFERHWSLNWLVRAFSPKSWDDVELHT